MRTSSNGRGSNINADNAYIWHLARELSGNPVGHWLAESNAWMEVMRLAFRYLDCDDDGVLSPKDIVTHLVSTSADAGAHADAWSAAPLWVARWCKRGLRAANSGGLLPANFRAALLASPEDSAQLGEGIDQLDDEGCEMDDNDFRALQ